MRILLMAVAMVCVIVGCKAGVNGENAEITAVDRDVKRETRNVGNFDAVTLIGCYDIVYKQGNTTKVEVVAPSRVMEKITTEVKDKTLTVSTKKIAGVTVINKRNDNATIYVTSPSLKAVTLIGSGDIVAKEQVKATKLDLFLQGSGDIDFNSIASSMITAKLQGSGDIKINKAKVTNDANITLQGSGDFKIGEISCAKSEVSLMGSGDFEIGEVSCTKFDVSLMGSGDINLGNVDCTGMNVRQQGGSLKIKNARTVNSDARLTGSGDMSLNLVSCSNLNVSLSGSGSMKFTGKTDVYNKKKMGSGDIYDSNLKSSKKIVVENNTQNSAYSPGGINAQP